MLPRCRLAPRHTFRIEPDCKMAAEGIHRLLASCVWCSVFCVGGFSQLLLLTEAQVSGVYEVRVEQGSPSVIPVQMRYGDAMTLSCQGVKDFIPVDFKEKCCNAYGSICSPGNIEAEYAALFPLAPELFQFWSGGDGKDTPARFQLPREKEGNRYRTLFSIGCRYPNNEVKSVDVTVAASTYRLAKPDQDASPGDQQDDRPHSPGDESSSPKTGPSTSTTTTVTPSPKEEARGHGSSIIPVPLLFSLPVSAAVCSLFL